MTNDDKKTSKMNHDKSSVRGVNIVAEATTPKPEKLQNGQSSPPITPPSPPAFDSKALDGMRILCIMCTILFHCMMYWGTLLPIDVGHRILHTVPVMRAIYFMPLGIDCFIVFSGLWATWQLIPAFESAAKELHNNTNKADKFGLLWGVVARYYKHRVVRILPAYITSFALILFAMDHSKDSNQLLRRNHDVLFEYCPVSAPLNFILMNNVVGFGGCGVHFWSLAIQIQFYLVFPWLLLLANPMDTRGFRRRVVKGALIFFLLNAGLRWAAAHAGNVVMPHPPYAHPDLGSADVDAAVRYYHTLYYQTPARIGNIAMGVLIAMFLLNGRAMSALKTRPRASRFALTLICTAIFITFYAIVLRSKPYGFVNEQKLWKHAKAYTALAYHGSPLHSLTAAAGIISIAFGLGPASRLIAAVLRSKFVLHISSLCYDIYLLHMTALYWFEALCIFFFGRGATFDAIVAWNPMAGYFAMVTATWICSYIVGIIHYTMHSYIRKIFFSDSTKKNGIRGVEKKIK